MAKPGRAGKPRSIEREVVHLGEAPTLEENVRRQLSGLQDPRFEVILRELRRRSLGLKDQRREQMMLHQQVIETILEERINKLQGSMGRPGEGTPHRSKARVANLTKMLNSSRAWREILEKAGKDAKAQRMLQEAARRAMKGMGPIQLRKKFTALTPLQARLIVEAGQGKAQRSRTLQIVKLTLAGLEPKQIAKKTGIKLEAVKEIIAQKETRKALGRAFDRAWERTHPEKLAFDERRLDERYGRIRSKFSALPLSQLKKEFDVLRSHLEHPNEYRNIHITDMNAMESGLKLRLDELENRPEHAVKERINAAIRKDEEIKSAQEIRRAMTLEIKEINDILDEIKRIRKTINRYYMPGTR